MTIKIGDVVKLKSGGVKMAVSHFSDDGTLAQCYWQNVAGDGAEPQNYVYPIAILDAVASDKAVTIGEDAVADGGSALPARRASWLNTRS